MNKKYCHFACKRCNIYWKQKCS